MQPGTQAMTEAERERAAILNMLAAQKAESMAIADYLPWWKVRLRFANRVAAAACNRIARRIERGDHKRNG